MSRAFDEVREEAYAQGIKQGIEQGLELERAKNIKLIMNSLKMTAEQAMDVLKIQKSEQPEYAAML